MADPSQLPPLPKDHLSHPENWTTGSEPATSKQKGFIKVLENQHKELVPEGGMDVDGLGKSEASEVIEKLKSGEEVDAPGKVSGKVQGDDEVGKKELEDRENGKKEEVGKESDDGENLNGASKRKSTTNGDDDGESNESAQSGNGKVDKATNGDSGSKQTNLDAAGKSESTDKVEKRDEADAKDTKDEAELKPTEDDERASKRPRTETKTKTTPAKGDKSDPIEIDSPTEDVKTPPSAGKTTSKTGGDTIPGDDAHLDHPENWTTGDEPATAKQKGFLKVLENQKGVSVGGVEEMGKSEASEKIDELKKR